MKCPNPDCHEVELVPAKCQQTFTYEGIQDDRYFYLLGEFWYCPGEVCIYQNKAGDLQRITK